MIKQRKYCPDILVQSATVRAALKSLEAALLGRHLTHCVAEAVAANDPKETEKKIQELLELFRRAYGSRALAR